MGKGGLTPILQRFKVIRRLSTVLLVNKPVQTIESGDKMVESVNYVEIKTKSGKKYQGHLSYQMMQVLRDKTDGWLELHNERYAKPLFIDIQFIEYWKEIHGKFEV